MGGFCLAGAAPSRLIALRVNLSSVHEHHVEVAPPGKLDLWV